VVLARPGAPPMSALVCKVVGRIWAAWVTGIAVVFVSVENAGGIDRGSFFILTGRDDGVIIARKGATYAIPPSRHLTAPGRF
jgi:hypothetical protein